ncbi:hypothetical protein C8Q75DRAFT_863031 [Abortiporus biennis]|nr:hypothetical protein C8Q75DRAFT_863031 [Abortiporus biennis]
MQSHSSYTVDSESDSKDPHLTSGFDEWKTRCIVGLGICSCLACAKLSGNCTIINQSVNLVPQKKENALVGVEDKLFWVKPFLLFQKSPYFQDLFQSSDPSKKPRTIYVIPDVTANDFTCFIKLVNDYDRTKRYKIETLIKPGYYLFLKTPKLREEIKNLESYYGMKKTGFTNHIAYTEIITSNIQFLTREDLQILLDNQQFVIHEWLDFCQHFGGMALNATCKGQMCSFALKNFMLPEKRQYYVENGFRDPVGTLDTISCAFSGLLQAASGGREGLCSLCASTVTEYCEDTKLHIWRAVKTK